MERMWTRTYLFLLLVRIYFATSPSYIHPDENFQGPEVIAGCIFDLPHRQTWEFTTAAPVRSIFPLWPVFALPMQVLQLLWTGVGTDVPPQVTYYVLRVLMFILSFVLEDWAIHDLVQSPRYQRLAATLVASSYVTWTYQTHTFSNSVETLAVLWSLVMIQRIRDTKQTNPLLSPAILGVILAFGFFNRITFIAFTAVPLLFLAPHFARRPLTVLVLFFSAIITAVLAIIADTQFYNPSYTLRDIVSKPTITPWNSILYNSSTENLSAHGLHPRYQHLLVNIPQLLGPALLLLPATFKSSLTTLPTLSFLSGLFFLSLIPHQEARFLLPLPPLLLSSLRLPKARRHVRLWLAAWIPFNLLFAILMGIYHQGGVIPAQIWVGHPNNTVANGDGAAKEVFWWRTYPPPVYLLGKSAVAKTTDLMGMPFADVQARVQQGLGDCSPEGGKSVGLVAPWSSVELDAWVAHGQDSGVQLREEWRWTKHFNLDDMEIGEDGIWSTLKRVVGRRGLVVWNVRRSCHDGSGPVLGGDW